MAKLPDYIDKTDKKAVAAYFIKQRQFNEYREFLDILIEREGKNYTTVIGQPVEENFEYLRSLGYTVELVSHITWKVTKPLDTLNLSG
jgi:predicted house-cleaning NTP pyrophosphatase (Maf/HAM1 superfamily)